MKEKLNYFAMAAVAMFLFSCNGEMKEVSNDVLALVTVSVNNFSVSQEEFLDKPSGQAERPTTRATSVDSYKGLKTLTLAFYKDDGTEQFKTTHTKGSMSEGDTFGEFSTTLPIGSYTMVVLGYVLYDDDVLALTNPTQAEYTVNAPRETFAATQVVNVTSSTPLNLTATLNRIIACLQVISTDGCTADVNKVRMTFSAGGKKFSPTTGLATANTGSVSTVSNNFTVGTSSTSTGFVFLTSDKQTMDVTIETLDSEGNTIYSTLVKNVPFQRNRKTKLTGSVYPTEASARASSFQVDTEWLPDHNMNF